MQVLVKSVPVYVTKWFGVVAGYKLPVIRTDVVEDKTGKRTHYLVKSKTGHYVTLYEHEITIVVIQK